jgi:hypothetical protein
MNEEDEAFKDLEQAQGWRKRQIQEVNAAFDEQYLKHSIERDLVENLRSARNSTLEEVAAEFDKMKAFGDTAQSFALFVRNMKN